MDPILSSSNMGSTIPTPTTIIKKEVSPSPQPNQAIEQAIIAASQPTQLTKLQNQEQAIKDLQRTIDAIQGPQKAFEISVHQETHAIMIKVKNKETGDLIREVPSEKVLDALAKLMEVTGLIVDKKV